MRPDQSNTKIIHNYVAMPDKPMFCAKDVAAATGVNIRTVRNVLPNLEKRGFVVRSRTRVSGRAYYRQASADEMARKAKLYVSFLARKRLRKHILRSMTQGVWYSSLSLRIEAGTPNVDFAFLSSMADDGLIEKGVHQLERGKNKSYYWRKINAQS
jgi:DNA-binding transcriptional regulator YhcF (GntR family)